MHARLERLTEMSEADGIVTRWLLEPRRPHARYLRVLVEVPGYGGHEATYEYEEWYVPASGGWRMSKYQYEVRWAPAPAGRWAEHWHAGTFHRHCDPPGHKGPSPHYQGQPVVSLDMARQELRLRYANGAAALPCAGLVPQVAKAVKRVINRVQRRKATPVHRRARRHHGPR